MQLSLRKFCPRATHSLQVALHQCSVQVALRMLPVQSPYASFSAPVARRTELCARYSAQVSLRNCLFASALRKLLCAASRSPRVLRASFSVQYFPRECASRSTRIRESCCFPAEAARMTSCIALLRLKTAAFPRRTCGFPRAQRGSNPRLSQATRAAAQPRALREARSQQRVDPGYTSSQKSFDIAHADFRSGPKSRALATTHPPPERKDLPPELPHALRIFSLETTLSFLSC